MGIVRDVLGQTFHEKLDFKKSHILSPTNMHENRSGIFEQGSAVQEWASQRGLERDLRTVISTPQSGTKETA